MEKKITKAQRFEQIKAIPEVAANPDMVEFLDHEIELLNKKSNSKKPTKTQVENDALKVVILSVLSHDKGMTASEVLASSDEFSGMSNQKISALLNQLVKLGVVNKDTDSKKSVFKLV